MFHNRLFRETVRNVYMMSMVGLTAYGIQTGKPASIATVSTLAAATASRAVCQRFMGKPLREQLQRLLGALQDVEEQNQVLNEGLQRSFTTGKALQNENAQLQTRAGELESLLSQVKAELTKTLTDLKKAEDDNREWQIAEAQWKVALAEYRKPLEMEVARLKDACKHYQTQYQGAVDELNATLDRKNELNARIEYLQLQLTALLAPKKLDGELDTNRFANSLCDWFNKSSPAIVVDAESTDVKGTDWVLMFRLRNKRDAARIREMATAMKIDFSLPTDPSIKISDDRMTITVHRAEVHNESRYLKIDPTWLKDALVFPKGGKLEPHHVRISGSTESGKSTFTSNAIGVLIANIPFLKVELADPLLKGRSEWKTLEPTYVGEDATVAGFIQFYEDYLAIDSGKAEPGHPRLFLLDEFDKVMQRHPELIPMALELWKSGRHFGFYLWCIGQSAMVGKWGLNIEDIDNLVGIYIGKSIERGFSDSAEDPGYTSRLREAWHNARAQGIEYLCLVRPHTTNRRPFLAKMPAPGTFGTGGEALKIAEESQERERLDYYNAEFNIGADTIANLNNLLQQPSEPVKPTEATGSNPDPVTAQVIALHLQGRKPHHIVKEIWGINPSKSAIYQGKKSQVEGIIRDYENRKG